MKTNRNVAQGWVEIQKLRSPFSLLCLSSSSFIKKSGFPFLSSKCSIWLQKECLWRRLECCMSLQAPMVAGTNMMFMPWCTRSSHNAALPAAGLSGPPGLGILGVSACWYCGEEKKRGGGHGQTSGTLLSCWSWRCIQPVEEYWCLIPIPKKELQWYKLPVAHSAVQRPLPVFKLCHQCMNYPVPTTQKRHTAL